MQEFQNKEQLLNLLQQGAIVVSPNNRLSASLLKTYFDFCKKNTLVKPQCLPYQQMLLAWFEHLRFHDYEHNPPLLLNEAQCRYLWQTIIQETSAITFSEGLLNAVMQAWKQCEQWLVEPNNSNFSYTPQTQYFQNWWQTFNKRLDTLQAISEYQLVPYLINSQLSFISKPLVWLCFDEFTPAQSALQDHLKTQGIAQYHYDLAKNQVTTQVFAAENTKKEYEQLIHWLKQNINQGKQSIGVVVPELQQKAHSLKRLLTQHFDSNLFNFSLGEPLINYPLVSHALSLLSLDSQLTAQQADLLLQSPYLASAKQEFLSRAQFLQDSSLLQQGQFDLKEFIHQVNNYSPQLASHLDQLTTYPNIASFSEWINLFHSRLNHLGFPGDLGLNSIQYQCYQRFVSLFDEFRQLALIKNKCTKQEALLALTQLASNTIFQAQTNNALIQISGLLEASGCEFDCLWVLGLTDRCLPATTQLSAFIPPHLQHTLAMPHSSAARELHFAQQTLQRLQRGSKWVVFSYAHLEGDTPNLPSTLISHFSDFIAPIIELSTNEQSFIISRLDSYSLPLLDDETLSGGTALLANQAKCPFKAFAEHRLKAKPLLNALEGIDNKERGKVLHKMMELLWHDLKTQAQLIEYPPQKLELLIDKSIKQALQNQALNSSILIQELEQLRLKRLVLSYLIWEKQRPAFIIEALEQSYSFNLAGLEIKVRVDRLDKVADKKWVIDYKSTLPTSKPWNEDRPQEPQLLLYALLDEKINTLVLMQIKTGKILCSGLSEEQLDIKGISTLKKEEHWQEIRKQWQEQLTHLALEIQQGYCPPQPINTTICTYCDFQNLCRIEY